EGLHAGREGKGHSAWLAYGYVLAAEEARVIAGHGCDIREYDRALLARLCSRVENTTVTYEFARASCGRVTDRLYGRVPRLFMTPFLRAMKAVLGPHALLDFLDAFRYPLARAGAITTE